MPPTVADNVVEERLAKAAFALKLEVLPGQGIERVAEEAVRLSALLGVKVETRFNGIRLVCWPGEAAEEMVGRYRREVSGAGA